jgi:hypothetical protein
MTSTSGRKGISPQCRKGWVDKMLVAQRIRSESHDDGSPLVFRLACNDDGATPRHRLLGTWPSVDCSPVFPFPPHSSSASNTAAAGVCACIRVWKRHMGWDDEMIELLGRGLIWSRASCWTGGLDQLDRHACRLTNGRCRACTQQQCVCVAVLPLSYRFPSILHKLLTMFVHARSIVRQERVEPMNFMGIKTEKW